VQLGCKVSRAKSLTANLKEPESFLKIFPRSPVQMSDPIAWQGIFLAHHRQPAWEMPENNLSQHILSINLGSASKIEFKQSTGLAPHQFVIRCRVERAKELLLHSSLGIADIAAEVGFANQSHLNRHFKRIVGVTPHVVISDRKNLSNTART
jgi:hypothetical protein